MDGMTRSEIDLPTQNIVRVEAAARSEDIIESSDLLFSTGSSASRTSSLQRVAIKAYVVGGKDVLKTWVKNSAAIVLLPDEEGWKSKKIRVLADEISFYNQAIVVVPDVYRGLSFNRTFYEEGKFFNGTTEGDQTEITAQSSASLLQSSVDKSSTVKDSLDSWQSSQSSRRILDDVVATMKHIYDSFDVKSISLAGVGYGGGRALEIACDLSDIASYAQWREMLELQSYAEYQLNRSNPNMNTMENRKELDTFQKELGMTYQIASKVLEKFDNVLRARTAAAVLSNRTLVLMGEENQEPKPQYQSMLEEILEDENNDNTTMTTSNRLNNINNQSSEIITTPVADINDQIELPSDGIDYLTALSDDAIKELTMEEIMERAFQSGNVISSSEASRGSTKTVSEFTEDNTLTQVIRTMSEEERLIAEIKSLQQAAHRAKNKNLIVEYPSITPVDIAKKFVPRSILALSPTNYNVQSVGSSIRIPSFFAFGDHATNQQGAR